jgi:hypothetical protein
VVVVEAKDGSKQGSFVQTVVIPEIQTQLEEVEEDVCVEVSMLLNLCFSSSMMLRQNKLER